MKFDTPATGPNLIDQARVVSHPHDRLDGPLKVSGHAPYAYEYHDVAPDAACGYMLGAGIGKGRIDTMDTAAAESAPGVLMVMTHRNAPRQGKGQHAAPQLQDAEIKHHDQSIAFVVAETFEQARAAAQMIKVTYVAEKGRFDLEAEKHKGVAPEGSQPADTSVGDFDCAFAAAAQKIDVTYTTPDQAHSMMEPHASLAMWRGDALTLYTSHQVMHWARQGMAETLGIPEEKIRAISAYAANQTRLLYAGANRVTTHRLTELDLPLGASMRAPGEAVGLLALECATDELAEKLDIDPIEFRVMNDTAFDPEKGPERPFSTRKLVECLRTGAERFGWNRRNPRPAQVRDGRWMVGIGVASAIRDNLVMPSGARLRLDGEGVLTVETQMTDIGTGSYTVLGQVAAEMMGLPLDKVRVKLGDTAFPKAAGSGGSWGANSAGTGVYYACEALQAAIAQKAGFNTTDARFADGRITAGNRSLSLAEVAGADGVVAECEVKFGDPTKKYAQAGFGAHFAEVGVDRDTGEVRVRRMLSVCAAGRILNPKTARSQCLGGMTMGIGAALMEEQVVDTRHGYFVNHDLAEYQVPVHADIPDVDVVFLEELDDKSSPLKAKGVGELGICGVGAAVANAVYNATGVRIREDPLTLDKILAGLPEMAG